MKQEGQISFSEWDRDKLQDASTHILGWYSKLLREYGSGFWLEEGYDLLTKVIQLQSSVKEITFKGRGIDLTYYSQYMCDRLGDVSEKYKNGFELDPYFLFRVDNSNLLPRELNTILRRHESIGEEAQNQLGANFATSVISFPHERFAKNHFNGKVYLFNNTPLNEGIRSELNSILEDLDF